MFCNPFGIGLKVSKVGGWGRGSIQLRKILAYELRRECSAGFYGDVSKEISRGFKKGQLHDYLVKERLHLDIMRLSLNL
jgi:hypothetical protein